MPRRQRLCCSLSAEPSGARLWRLPYSQSNSILSRNDVMSRTATLPILNPATDMRQLIALAKYPVFCLAPGQRRIEYKDRVGDKPFYFFVTSDEGSQIPTISDSDIFIYAVSQLTASYNRGENLSAEIPFRPNNVLRFLGRATGGRQRSLLADSLRRLERANFTGSISLGPDGDPPPGT